MNEAIKPANIDAQTVASFGHEWATHDQSGLTPSEKQQMFDDYFRIFPWHELAADAEGFHMMRGCGLTDIRFSETSPFWVAVGIKA